MKEKRNKTGRNPKLDPAVFRYTVRFNEEEHNRFLAMFEKSGVYAKSVFIKAHLRSAAVQGAESGQDAGGLLHQTVRFPCAVPRGRHDYNQVVKELRLHFFREKRRMALLYKLEQQTVELVKLSRQIVELSREMEAKWSQKSV